MSHKIAAFTVGVLVMLTTALGGCGARVTFPDPGLAQAVAQHLGVKVDLLRTGAITKITELDASNRGIASLGGIAALQSLQALNLDGNQLTDIQPLVDANLPNLRQVRIAGNPLPCGLDSAVYSEVKALRQRGVTVNWLPSFVVSLGDHSYISDMVQAQDGSLVAMNEAYLFHVNLLGKDAESYQSPDYPGLANIVQGTGMVLRNGSPNENAQWEYSFRFPGGFDSKYQLHYPAGDYRMIRISDGYLLVGLPFWRQEESAIVVKLDVHNNEVWARTYLGEGGGMSAIPLSNGFVILCKKGLIQLDSEGKKVNTLDFVTHGVGQVRSEKIVQTQDGYTIMGSPIGHQEATALVTFTADLAVKTVIQIPVPDGPEDYSMVYDFDATEDGGFVLAVHNWAFPELSADGLLVKIDATGKILWSRPYKDYALGFVIQTADGGFAVGAYAKGWKTFIIKTNENGLMDGQ